MPIDSIWMLAEDIFAKPRVVGDLTECYFYHEMDIPGYGHVGGLFDFRGRERQYLGDVDFKGKRVLDVGTASGHLCFYMEKEGAEVIGYDLSEEDAWDVVPFRGYNYEEFLLARKAHVRKINNAFWLAHTAFRSKAKMIYGSVYAVPSELGPVDISVFGSILLHVRDPFLALENALRLTRETVIVVERIPHPFSLRFPLKLGKPCMRFLPEYKVCEPKETWWELTPEIIQKFLGVLGFERTRVTHHSQKGRGETHRFFTVVGQRTKAFLADAPNR